MLDSAKLDLSSTRRSAERDVWRSVSDLLGGVLPVAVWLALWTWMALAVVRPLSGVFPAADHGPAARTTSSAVHVTSASEPPPGDAG